MGIRNTEKLARRAKGRLATLTQLEAESGVPYTTLRDMALRGDLPYLRIGSAYYIDRGDWAGLVDRLKVRRAV